MKESALYDGTGKLAEAIADLYGVPPKSQVRIAALIKEAKIGLSIEGKSKRLPDDVKLAIWRWHYDRLQSMVDPVEILSQTESVELYSQTPGNETVEIISQMPQSDSMKLFSQDDHNGAVKLFSQCNDLDRVRIAFYTQKQGVRVRQVIALDGFYINALILATGITKQDVPKWVQSAVDSWMAFDVHLPVTRQVKFLIVQKVTAELERLKPSSIARPH